MKQSKNFVQLLPVGFYFDNHNGIYNMLYVTEMAVKLGLKVDKVEKALLKMQQKELPRVQKF